MHRSFASLSTINPHPPQTSFDISTDSSLQLWHSTKNPSLARCSALSDAESPARESLEHRELSIHPVAKGAENKKYFHPRYPKTSFVPAKCSTKPKWRFDFGKRGGEKRVHTRIRYSKVRREGLRKFKRKYRKFFIYFVG